MCACVRVSNTRRKQTTLKLVHSGTIENLKAHLNSFEKAAEGDATSTATSAVTRLREIEQAPPCSSYKKLLSLREMEVWHNKFESTTNKDELTEVKVDWVETKKPILDLISACKSALGEVEQAKKTPPRWKDQKREAKARLAASTIFSRSPRHQRTSHQSQWLMKVQLPLKIRNNLTLRSP